MEINENILKLSGSVSIPEALEVGQNYHVSLDGQITGRSDDSNEDGTLDTSWKFRPVRVEILLPTGRVVKAKDKRKLSQKLRGKLWIVWNESGSQLSEQEFYDQSMGKIIANCEQLLN